MNRFLSLFIILVVSFLFLSAACSKSDEQLSERESVFLDDGNGNQNGGEVAIDDTSVRDAETQSAIERNGYQESDKTESDGTKISTMYDGFGNKTERRFFRQHPLIEAMVLRTSSNGQKEILLFGHNGEVKSVPQNMIERAMTASADELAQAAGISQGSKPKALSFADLAEPMTDAALPPQIVSESSSNSQNAETEIAEKLDKRKPENTKIKNEPQNLKQAELEYQAEINKANLRAKKSQTEKSNNR